MSKLFIRWVMFLQAIIIASCDIYRVLSSYMFQNGNYEYGVVIVHFIFVALIYFFLAAQAREEESDNFVLGIGSFFITYLGVITVLEKSNNQGWEFLVSMIVVLPCVGILWLLVALTRPKRDINKSGDTDPHNDGRE